MRTVAWIWPFVLLAAGGWASASVAETPRVQAPASMRAAQLPLRRDDQELAGTGTGWRALTMLVVLGAAGGWLLWRRGLLQGAAWRKARPPRELHAVTRLASQPLTPQASVHAVRWQGEVLLLGCTPQQVTLLARRPAEAADEETA